MKVLALTRYGRLGASSRMRTHQYVQSWQAMGIDVQVSPLLRDDYIKRLYAKKTTNWLAVIYDYLMQAIRLSSARKYDLVWIEKELFPNLPAWFEQMLSALNIRYVVDYDDAIFHNYDLNLRPAKRLLADKIDKVMRNSALVVCGNAYLAERAHTAGSRRVEIVPTVVDLDRYAVVKSKIRPGLVVGWIGSPSTVKYLDVVLPALKIVASEFPLQLRIIGAQLASLDLDVVCSSWSEESEASQIQDFDVGIMPLIDCPWERGKCGYKLVQYMACGRPVVASPVGVNKDIVVHGINGYLASTIDEWALAFRSLYLDSHSRLVMGEKGRMLVEEKYCLQITAPRLVQLFKEVVSAGKWTS